MFSTIGFQDGDETMLSLDSRINNFSCLQCPSIAQFHVGVAPFLSFQAYSSQRSTGSEQALYQPQPLLLNARVQTATRDISSDRTIARHYLVGIELWLVAERGRSCGW